MQVVFTAKAEAYIAEGRDALEAMMTSDHVLFIGFPLSRQYGDGPKITAAPNGGPLVGLGTMRRHLVADCLETFAGSLTVFIRFNADMKRSSKVEFSVQHEELTAVFSD